MDTCDEKPPPSMDTASRRIPAASILRREVRKHINRVDAICLLHGSGLRRRSFNLQNI